MGHVRRPLSLLVAAICAVLALPAAAQSVNRQFQTPSGQIMCAYFSFTDVPPQIRCDLLFLNDRAAVITRSGKGRLVKVTDAVGDPTSRRLAYGTSTRFGIYTCTSRRSGLTCTNRRTRHGFTVSRQSQKVF
jgi:hypothetical protein